MAHEDSPRELTNHKVNGVNDRFRIRVLDEPGPGGASTFYEVGFDSEGRYLSCDVKFHVGELLRSGPNGLTHEVLLAIVEDRLASFQDGPYACRENEIALRHVRIAMDALKERTQDRVARGVEGTSTV